jgi:hypothetical protein
MAIQITRVGIVSDHADTILDGQPLIKFNQTTLFGAKLKTEDEGVANLRDITDIISTAVGTGIGTNFVLTYDPNADNFVFISPDAVVDSAAGSLSGAVGLSTTVINQLDEALDNKIDLDAGTWT